MGFLRKKNDSGTIIENIYIKKPMKNNDVEHLILHNSNRTRILLLLGVLLTCLWITFRSSF